MSHCREEPVRRYLLFAVFTLRMASRSWSTLRRQIEIPQTLKSSSPSKNERTLTLPIQAIVPIVLSMLLPVQVPRKPPGDFDFRFRYGVCSTVELDTFTGWFTGELPGETPAMVQLSLGADQMAHLYDLVTQVGFFNYPSIFKGEQGEPPRTKGSPFVVKYQMEVRSGGRIHSVQWDDDQTATGPQADGLRRLFSWAITFIVNAPEVTPLALAAERCGSETLASRRDDTLVALRNASRSWSAMPSATPTASDTLAHPPESRFDGFPIASGSVNSQLGGGV